MKMKQFAAFLMAMTCAITLPVYADDDDHKNYVTIDVEGVGTFENIISNAPFDIEFLQGSQQKVSVYGDPAQVNNVNFTIVGKTLYVAAKENTAANHVKVHIVAPDLLCAVVASSGDIDVKNIVNTKFTATVSGTGDIEIVGSTDEGDFTVNSSGDIDAEEFRVKNLNVMVNGSGKVDCRCADILNVNIVGSGSVEVNGRPRTINTAGRKSGIHFDH